ncbi:neuronal acetylcholine receptor subunit non-alpha-2-like [Ostrea edulis]|uniref:neuronal acetylcholine receptor subunit non-alpha-2-like n=1 Tax=Ostrea edulis TaxID=37623 RepID=UPI0024AF7B60|nr:neuronal acetylcholine receptor subunit non-alpha-2-like [Ostrea edulis]
MKIILVLLETQWIIRLMFAYTLTDEQNLHTSLLTGYNRDLRPGYDRNKPLGINASFYLFSINDFDLNTGKFTITGVFLLNWNDERLSWNPATYNQGNTTSIPQKKIWLPNFINVNPFKDIKGLGSDLITVDVDYSGLCSWYAVQAFEVICDPDVTKYPFDTQYCALKFFIWGYDKTAVNLYFESSRVILTLYSENGIWEITDSTTHKQLHFHGNEEFVVGFHLKRRTDYYIASLILPISSISLLLGFVFLLPAESGERVGFATTILLSTVVYLTIIQGKLPEASEPNMSILGYILVSYVLSGTILVVFVIISLRIQNSPCDKPIPGIFVRFVVCCRRKRKMVDVKDIDSKSTIFKEDEDSQVTWKDVGTYFDLVCFFISVIQFMVTVTVYFSLVCA